MKKANVFMAGAMLALFLVAIRDGNTSAMFTSAIAFVCFLKVGCE